MINDLHQRHCKERTDLVERVRLMLEIDPAVVAAWLAGSLGCDDADAWSGIDLWVIVNGSRDLIEIVSNEQLLRLGTPVYSMEIEANAPPSGKYMMAWYRGADWPQHVDWTWQSASLAKIPHDVHLLFDRVGLPRVPFSTLVVDQAIGRAAERAAWFWMMCPVAAKYVARRDNWKVLELLAPLRRVPDEMSALLGVTIPATDRSHENQVPTGPRAQLDLLTALGVEVESLMASVPWSAAPIQRELSSQASRAIHVVRTLLDADTNAGEEAHPSSI